MKRMFHSIFLALTVLIGLSGLYMPQAQAYEQYWNGDSNYILVYGHMGVAEYADTSSAVLKKDGDTKVIAMNIVYVDTHHDNAVTDTQCWYFGYTAEPALYYYRSKTSEWVRIGGDATYDMMRTGAQVAWKAIYGYNWS